MVSSPQSPPKKKPRVPWPLRLLLILTLAYLGWCAVLYSKQDSLIFLTNQAGPGTPQLPHRRDFEQVWITAPDGVKVEGWFFHATIATKAEPAAPHPCIVIFHGNGDLIDNAQDYGDFFLSLGLNVLLIEYRGYGRSGGMSTPDGSPRGEPSEHAIVDDSLLFLDWLSARKDVLPNKIVLYGRSIGTGVAAQVAARRSSPPAAIILESPFSSVAAFAAGFGAPAILLKHPFRTDKALPPLAASGLPVLILHSRADQVISFSHAERLKALMPTATLVETTGIHYTSPLDQPACEQAIHGFLDRAKIITGR